MEAMGIVRSRGVVSQSGLAGTGGAGQFDSNILAKINNWWSAGAAFPRPYSIAWGILRYGRGRFGAQQSGNSQVWE
jgi:hypothetical protein